MQARSASSAKNWPGWRMAGTSRTIMSRSTPPPTALMAPTSTTPGRGMPAARASCRPTTAKAGVPMASMVPTSLSTTRRWAMLRRNTPTSRVAVRIRGR